jgi:hypothetical protein
VTVVVGVLTIAAVIVFAFWPRVPRPCRATFENVRVGMTLAEVCATVGGGPGDFTEGRSLAYITSQVRYGRPVEFGRHVWAAEDAFLSVEFDGDRVKSIDIGDPDVVREPLLLDRLRARLGL